MPAGSVHPLLNDDGEYLNKYTCGVAYFLTPFYLITLASVSPDWRTEDKIFTDPFAYSVAFGGFVIGFLGLVLLRKVLLREYKDKIVSWTLVSVFLGTNLFHYSTKEMGMSHVYSFTIIAFLLWHVPRFYKQTNWGNAFLLGLSFGWLVLIRPTNIVVGLFILLYDVYSWKDLFGRLRLWLSKVKLIPIIIGAFILMWVPQMVYWHEMTGEWFRYSYTDEGFPYYMAPKIAAVLFDPQNGLFIYTPLALVMVGGLVSQTIKRKQSALPALLILIISTYVFASWWAWWFGGAFGARSYVELYALLALPLASVYQSIYSLDNKWLKRILLTGMGFLVYYSVRLSFLYNSLPGPWDGADWRWNWEKVFWIWRHLFG